MKIIVMCEGNSELYLINSLIKKGHIVFEHELLGDKPHHARQLKQLSPLINALPVEEEMLIYRIGDTLKDKLSFDGFELRKEKMQVFKYCTKPEIEILIIINENLLEEYNKASSKISAKSFIKPYLKKCSISDYFESHDIIGSIREYKRIKTHNNGEFYLADLLKNDDN